MIWATSPLRPELLTPLLLLPAARSAPLPNPLLPFQAEHSGSVMYEDRLFPQLRRVFILLSRGLMVRWLAAGA